MIFLECQNIENPNLVLLIRQLNNADSFLSAFNDILELRIKAQDLTFHNLLSCFPKSFQIHYNLDILFLDSKILQINKLSFLMILQSIGLKSILWEYDIF